MKQNRNRHRKVALAQGGATSVALDCERVLQAWWYGDNDLARVMMHLLLMTDGEGNVGISVRALAWTLNLSYQKMRTCLARLEREGEIELATQQATQLATHFSTQQSTHLIVAKSRYCGDLQRSNQRTLQRTNQRSEQRSFSVPVQEIAQVTQKSTQISSAESASSSGLQRSEQRSSSAPEQAATQFATQITDSDSASSSDLQRTLQRSSQPAATQFSTQESTQITPAVSSDCSGLQRSNQRSLQRSVKEKEIETEKKEEESFPHTPFKEVERKEKEKEKEKFVDDDVVVKTTMAPKNFGISSIRKGLGVSTIQPMSQDELKAARLRTHVSELRGDEVWREVMCMRFEITASDLDRYIDTFELECRCNGSLHNDANDCKRHCVNWLHKRREIEQKEKLNQQKHTIYASNFQRNNPRRRGFDPGIHSAKDYEADF